MSQQIMTAGFELTEGHRIAREQTHMKQGCFSPIGGFIGAFTPTVKPVHMEYPWS